MMRKAMRYREPILIGVVVFFGFLIANALGHAWEEALTAGVTSAVVLVIYQSKAERKKGGDE